MEQLINNIHYNQHITDFFKEKILSEKKSAKQLLQKVYRNIMEAYGISLQREPVSTDGKTISTDNIILHI